MIFILLLVTICFESITTIALAVEKPYYDLHDAENLFKEYLKEHKKSYNSIEYLERLKYFTASLKEINDRNARFPDTVFKVNRFADMGPVERERYLGSNPPVNGTTITLDIPDSSVAAPDELDWRKQGVVSHVKDQGICGGSFIFSAIGNIEGQYALKHKECIALSEQQMIDCLSVGSCDPGFTGAVFQELVEKKSGIMKEVDYPSYEYYEKKACSENTSKEVAFLKGGGPIKISDEATLKQKLADIGPLAISLNANDFYHYHKGILLPNACEREPNFNQDLLLVGYGEENGEQYWIIKNSWGADWGESGYVRLRRGVNACGIATRSSYTGTAIVA